MSYDKMYALGLTGTVRLNTSVYKCIKCVKINWI